MLPGAVVSVSRIALLLAAVTLGACRGAAHRVSVEPSAQASMPRSVTYREAGDRQLRAHIFERATSRSGPPRSSVLLFHGGGWSAGDPEWTFAAARRFADAGMVAISVEYRLSQGEITPIEALADVCAAFAWVRASARDLRIDPRHVAGYGVSAGGHLVASTATVGCPGAADSRSRAVPDALLLLSPALDLSGDEWFEQKLRGRSVAAAYSPADHVGPETPPTNIVMGEKDTLAPLSGARRYCDRLNQLGKRCQLNAFAGLGHLLTRNLDHQESDFDPDPQAREEGFQSHLRFLAELKFIEPAGK